MRGASDFFPYAYKCRKWTARVKMPSKWLESCQGRNHRQLPVWETSGWSTSKVFLTVGCLNKSSFVDQSPVVLLFHIRSPSPSFTAPEAAKLQVRTSRRMAFWTSTSYWQRGMGGLWLRRVNVWKTSGETRSYDDLHIVDFPCVNVYWRVTFLCFEIVRERENYFN